MSNVPIPTATLPRISRHAIWNYEYGLVVSPFSRILPESIADRVKPFKTRDYDRPRVLDDSSMYLAFFPRRFPHSKLFAPLVLTPDELLDRIVSLPSGVGYMLHRETMNSWIDLEEGLLSIIHTLMTTHWQKDDFPEITWPRWPHHARYRDSHPDRQSAFKYAKRAKQDFVVLSACVTFAISLWLQENEYLSFDRAWTALTNRRNDPIPLSYLDLLQDSVVCNLEAGFRPGAFLNPYLTRWRPFIGYFVRARVPIWFIWGFEETYERTPCVDRRMQEFYYPPREYIKAAQREIATYASMELPESFAGGGPAYHPPATVQQQSDQVWSTAPPPPPANEPPTEANSGQRSGESWEVFSERMKVSYERHLRNEKDQAKQSRLAREENARKQVLSKATVVFIWEQDEHVKTFYRRTRVRKDDAPSTFADVYPHQRIYWGHTNEWDLVPHLAAPPGVVVPDLYGSYYDDDDDLDYEGYSSQPAVLGTGMAPRLSGAFTRAMEAGAKFEADETAEDETVEPFSPLIPPLKSYLHMRHGFLCPDISCWNPNLHRLDALSSDNFHKVARSLLYTGVNVSPEVATSVTNCFNVTTNPSTSYLQLTRDWDINWNVRLNLWGVKLQFAKKGPNVVYILCPPRHSEDDSPWYVALTSATAVLLVYRQGWETMLEIARGLLELGIPFRTVIEHDRLPPEYEWNKKSRGLGIRPKNYTATKWDYLAYLECRKDVLRSRAGRAIRLRGGLVGRIASEVVPEVRVLEGPVLADEVVAHSGSTYYLDDGVSDETLDYISGVYHVFVKDGGNCVTHMSWWPKHDVFMKSGRFSDQWTPDAEQFYKNRVSELSELKGRLTTYSSSEWRDRLKYMKKQSDQFIGGSERLASQFITRNGQV